MPKYHNKPHDRITAKVDRGEMFQDKRECSLGLDVADGKHPSPKIRVVQVPLRLVIQGEPPMARRIRQRCRCLLARRFRMTECGESARRRRDMPASRPRSRPKAAESKWPPHKGAAEEHPTPACPFFALQEGKDTQRKGKRGENFGVGRERVARLVGVDKHGVTNATPCTRPFVTHTRANPPYDQRSGDDDKNGENVHRPEVVPTCHAKDARVDVIYPRWLRIHCGMIDLPAVQNVVGDRAVIVLVGEADAAIDGKSVGARRMTTSAMITTVIQRDSRRVIERSLISARLPSEWSADVRAKSPSRI